MERRQLLGFAVGPMGAATLGLVSLPIMTWIFPPADIGKLSMLQVVISLSTVLFCLGLDQAYVREYHESANRPSLLLNATAPGLLLLVLALICAVAFDPALLSMLLFGDRSYAIAAVTAWCLAVSYVSRFLSLILRMQDRGLAFSMSQLLSRLLLLGIVLTYALLPVSKTFGLLLLAQAAALTLTLCIFAWNTRLDWMPALLARFDRPLFRGLLAFGWPLVFAGAASWGLAALDRIFLRSMAGYDDLAVYSVAASIASGVTIFAGVFNIIWAPMVYKWVADQADVKRIDGVARQVAAAVMLLLCLAGAGSWILRYVLPRSYDGVVYLVAGCMVAPMFYTLSEVTGIGIAVKRRTMLSLMASLSAVCVNAVLCGVLVPHLGATGAMISTALAFWVFFVLRTEFSAAVWRRMARVRVHLYAVVAMILAVAYGLLGQAAPIMWVMAWCALFGVFAWMERSVIAQLWGVIRKKRVDLVA